MNELIERPEHYEPRDGGGIECLDAIRAQLGPVLFLGYLHGNVVKYMWRWMFKGGKQDIAKAQRFLKLLEENFPAPDGHYSRMKEITEITRQWESGHTPARTALRQIVNVLAKKASL